MMTNFQNVDEYGRREFITHAAKACLGVGLMPMAGSYIHDSVKALLLVHARQQHAMSFTST